MCLYQCSNSGEVLSHLPEKSPSPDVPQLQGFVSEHDHQVLPEEEKHKIYILNNQYKACCGVA